MSIEKMEEMDMYSDEELEYQADRLLREHRFLGVENGIFRERDLDRRTARECSWYGEEDWEEGVVPRYEESRISWGEAIDHARLSAQQRQALRLMQRMCDAHGRVRQELVAEAMGLRQGTVSKLLCRAYPRILRAFHELETREPSDWATRLFWEEIAYKWRLIYRKRVTRR
jgi:hypothetical protein